MSEGLTALVVLGLLLFGIGASLAALASAVWLVVIAFQTHVGWGIAVWFCYPFGAFAFVIQHWKRARWAGIVHFLTRSWRSWRSARRSCSTRHRRKTARPRSAPARLPEHQRHPTCLEEEPDEDARPAGRSRRCRPAGRCPRPRRDVHRLRREHRRRARPDRRGAGADAVRLRAGRRLRPGDAGGRAHGALPHRDRGRRTAHPG